MSVRGGGSDGPLFEYPDAPVTSITGRADQKSVINFRTDATGTDVEGSIDADEVFPALDEMASDLVAVVYAVSIDVEFGSAAAGDGDWIIVVWAKNEEALNPRSATTTGLTGFETGSELNETWPLYLSNGYNDGPAIGQTHYGIMSAWDIGRAYLEHFDEEDTLHFYGDSDDAVCHGNLHFHYDYVEASEFR